MFGFLQRERQDWWHRPPWASSNNCWDDAVDEIARMTQDFDAPWVGTGPSNEAFLALIGMAEEMLEGFRAAVPESSA